MTSNLDKLIARGREISEKATPGPWQRYQTEMDKLKGYWSVSRIPGQPSSDLVEKGFSFFVGYARELDAEPNATLIAESRTLLPKLIAIVERQREALENCAGGDLASGEGLYKAECARDAIAEVEKIASQVEPLPG